MTWYVSNSLSIPALFNRIFVGGLSRATTEGELREAFALVGIDICAVEFVHDRSTGLPRGFAFVSLRDHFERAVDTFAPGRLRSVTLDGHPLDIQSVPPRDALTPRMDR